jgi:DnaJ family protein C protein 2
VRKPNVQWVVKTANIDEALTLRQAVGDASLEVEAGAPPEGSCDEPDATEHVPAVAQFNLHLKAIEERVGRNRYGEGIKRTVGDASPAAQAAKAAAEAATKKKAAPAAGAAAWTDEDIVQLQKLAIKYPGGAVDRWRHIAHSLGGKYTEEQVLEQVKAIEKGIKSGTKPPSAVNARVPDAPVATDAVVADDWTPNQQKQLEGGLRDLKDYKEKDKFAKIAAMVDGKSAKQCHERFKYLCDMRKKSGAQ